MAELTFHEKATLIINNFRVIDHAAVLLKECSNIFNYKKTNFVKLKQTVRGDFFQLNGEKKNISNFFLQNDVTGTRERFFRFYFAQI